MYVYICFKSSMIIKTMHAQMVWKLLLLKYINYQKYDFVLPVETRVITLLKFKI